MSAEGCWSREPRALWRRSGARVVLLCPDTEDPLVLEGSGEVAWDLLDEPREQDDLVQALADHYQADVGVVERDVQPFLEELERAGAIVRS